MVSLPAQLTPPSEDDLEDIILSARYGELNELKQFIIEFGIDALADAKDGRGNGCLHMAAANGHNRRCQSPCASV